MSWDQDNFLAHDNFSYQTFDDYPQHFSKSIDINQSLMHQMNIDSKKIPAGPVVKEEIVESFVQAPKVQREQRSIQKQIELLKKKNETLTIFIIVLVVFILLSRTSMVSQPQYVFVPVNQANSLRPPTFTPTAPPLSPV